MKQQWNQKKWCWEDQPDSLLLKAWVKSWPCLTIFLTTVLMAGFIYWASETPQETVNLYYAWCRSSGVTNVTFTEWQTLRSNGLLPGQVQVPVAPPTMWIYFGGSH